MHVDEGWNVCCEKLGKIVQTKTKVLKGSLPSRLFINGLGSNTLR